MKKAVVSLMTIMLCGSVFAAALTAERNTARGMVTKINVGVYTGSVIYAGAMVSVNGSGYAVAASDATGCRVVGRASKTVDASLSASGAKTIDVDCGTFYWNTDSGGASKTSIGQIAYVVDDQTVSLTNRGTYAVVAGVVADYDSIKGQLAVDTRTFAAAASAPATLAVSGAATVGSTLAVSGALTAPNATISGATTSGTAVVSGAASLGNLTETGWIKAAGAITGATVVAVNGATVYITNAIPAVQTNIAQYTSGILVGVTYP